MPGGLFGILSSLRKEKKETRLLMLGLDNAGKTTILKALAQEDITSITPTQGFNIKNLSMDGVKLNVWDIGGQKAIREYWSNYYEGTSVLCYVVDSTDAKRLQEAREELFKLLSEPDLKEAFLLVYANKQDIKTALHSDKIEEILGLDSIKDRDWSIVACSAVTKVGLEDGI
jgi:ADP-ribosylation factor-like protein 3